MFTKLYVIALPIFFIIDMTWLGLIAKNLYRNQIGFLMTPNINWIAAIIFYLLFLIELVFFVISPAVYNGSWSQALLWGFLFGFIAYATYDLTNLAIVKDWPLLITVVDMIWGGVLAALVSVVTYFVAITFSL